jgi:hypothetical protein
MTSHDQGGVRRTLDSNYAAASEATGGVYARLGFRRVATACIVG